MVKVVLSFSCPHGSIKIFFALHRLINIDVSNEGQLFLLNANVSLPLLASPWVGCFSLPFERLLFHPLWPDILLSRSWQLFAILSILIWFGEQLISKMSRMREGGGRVSVDGGLEEVEGVGGEGEQIGVAVHGQDRHHQYHGQHTSASHFLPSARASSQWRDNWLGGHFILISSQELSSQSLYFYQSIITKAQWNLLIVTHASQVVFGKFLAVSRVSYQTIFVTY